MTNAPELEKEKEKLYKVSLAKVKDTLNSEILNNPVFEKLFHKEFDYFLYKTGTANFTVLVSDDKNSVSITSYSPIYDCRKEFAGKNKAFLRTIFSIKDGYLVCDFNQGVLFSKKDIEESGIRVSLDYETKLETVYSSKFFDANGIQISDNSFSDVYPFEEKSREIDLRERVMSSFHKPKFRLNGFPKIPIHVIRAIVRNTYRNYESLGVIHSNMGTATRDGYTDVICGLYTCHDSRPDLLRGFNRIAETKGNKNSDLRFKIINDYAENINEAYDNAMNSFKESIEKLNDNNIDKKTIKALNDYLNDNNK